jgi:hypothetical protein
LVVSILAINIYRSEFLISGGKYLNGHRRITMLYVMPTIYIILKPLTFWFEIKEFQKTFSSIHPAHIGLQTSHMSSTGQLAYLFVYP